MRNRIIGLGIILLTAGITQEAEAQRLLSLDSCRAMALRNNKQMSVARVKQEVAANLRSTYQIFASHQCPWWLRVDEQGDFAAE